MELQIPINGRKYMDNWGHKPTVDGRNRAPVDVVDIPVFII